MGLQQRRIKPGDVIRLKAGHHSRLVSMALDRKAFLQMAEWLHTSSPDVSPMVSLDHESGVTEVGELTTYRDGGQFDILN